MTITITTRQILKILYVLSWILFVGICIEAGGFIFNAFFTLTINPVDAKHFWQEIDLSELYAFDHGHFFAETLAICIVAVLNCACKGIAVAALHPLPPRNCSATTLLWERKYRLTAICSPSSACSRRRSSRQWR